MIVMWHVCRRFQEVKMLSKEELSRYSRQIQMADFGIQSQERLKTARVLVIGAGGLGCSVIQYLSAAGVGNITIVDGDIVAESNLQRQILYTANDVGKYKAQQAAIRASELNSFIQLHSVPSFLNTQLAFELITNTDLVIDCTDNLGTRYLINDVCVNLNKTFISAALHKYEGQLGIYNLDLNKQERGTNYRDVFPENIHAVQDCNEAGVIATLPGIMGLLQANEAIKYFTDKKSCLCDELLVFDSKTMLQNLFKINKTETQVFSKEAILERDYVLPCSSKEELKGVNFLKLLEDSSVVIVDVRDLDEQPKLNGIRHIAIPLAKIEDGIEELKNYEQIYFICKSGVRSRLAKEKSMNFLKNKVVEACNFGVDELIKAWSKNELVQ